MKCIKKCLQLQLQLQHCLMALVDLARDNCSMWNSINYAERNAIIVTLTHL
jgi:hypothetical protein